jgi:hypothetical protein
MPDREKAIRILEGNYKNFVLRHNGELLTVNELIALLKAQEPRVMTLEEVNALDWDYCYLEQERLPGKEYRGMLGKYIMTCVTWPSITAAKISQGMDNYGKTWRCWTSRPTEAEREAIPWE